MFSYNAFSIGLLLSFTSLLLATKKYNPAGIRLFLVLSNGILGTYWGWMVYLRYARMENEASKEVGLL